MDITEVRNDIMTTLEAHGFTQPDADPTERRSEAHGSLRFKIGTSFGEVAVTVLTGKDRLEVLRIVSDLSREEAIARIEQYIRRYQR